MTAIVIQLTPAKRLRMQIKRATSNLRGLAKCEPTLQHDPDAEARIFRNLLFRSLYRADAEQAIAELTAEGDLPDILIEVRQSKCWTNCDTCGGEIHPGDQIALCHKTRIGECIRCFDKD